MQVLGDRFGPMQLGLYRFLMQSVFSSVVMWRGRLLFCPPAPRTRALLFARGFLGTGGMLCYFFALTHMSLADATVLVFTSACVHTCGITFHCVFVWGAVRRQAWLRWHMFLSVCGTTSVTQRDLQRPLWLHP